MAEVILVDERDEQIGSKEKMRAHIDGDLHRAFSVLLYNSKGEMLIHKRAETKYHCGGLWTNACCSHPRPGEDTLKAAHRRLREELGYTNISLEEKFVFTYKATFDNGLTEYEIDHVFVAYVQEDPPRVDPSEIDGYCWVNTKQLYKDIDENPDAYTVWFRHIVQKIAEYL